ncbi:transcription antitermination factor NusB [Geopsychrobacter electrodiphilus]|uniref:transcription antitermination factor NusB n=1 Tax=Geopsychrobacter electrodiphilus TaxID=225196 RepID=UPI00036F8FF2|nr:transcription antitermination factor NusB [Geopsychrobacter electrodiphilus]
MQIQHRRLGRECALKILFALRLDTNLGLEELLERFWQGFRFADDALGEPLDSLDKPVPESAKRFTEQLVRGIVEYRSVLDQRISEAAKNWSLERMTAVDLSILRVAVFELCYMSDIPSPVTMNEAIEIAKRYGTKESPAFINGLLDKISKTVDKKDS